MSSRKLVPGPTRPRWRCPWWFTRTCPPTSARSPARALALSLETSWACPRVVTRLISSASLPDFDPMIGSIAHGVRVAIAIFNDAALHARLRGPSPRPDPDGARLYVPRDRGPGRRRGAPGDPCSSRWGEAAWTISRRPGP